MQHDLIRQKIEAGWIGDWKQFQHFNTRFIIDPTKQNLAEEIAKIKNVYEKNAFLKNFFHSHINQ